MIIQQVAQVKQGLASSSLCSRAGSTQHSGYNELFELQEKQLTSECHRSFSTRNYDVSVNKCLIHKT